jgi:hypothetical protein
MFAVENSHVDIVNWAREIGLNSDYPINNYKKKDTLFF